MDQTEPDRFNQHDQGPSDIFKDRPLPLIHVFATENRANLIEWVCNQEVGNSIRGSDLSDELDIRSEGLSKHCKELETFGLVEIEELSWYQYTVVDSPTRKPVCDFVEQCSRTGVPVNELMKTSTRRKLLDFFISRVDYHSHLSKSKIGDRINAVRQAVGKHIGIMVDAGIVAIDDSGANDTYYPDIMTKTYRTATTASQELAQYYKNQTGDLDLN